MAQTQKTLFPIKPYIIDKFTRAENEKEKIEKSGLPNALKSEAIKNIEKTKKMSEKQKQKEHQLSPKKIIEKIKNTLKNQQEKIFYSLEPLSASKITTYKGCPFGYFLEYVIKIRPPKTFVNIYVGSAIHYVIAEFNKGSLNSLEELINGKKQDGKKILGWKAMWYKIAESGEVVFNDDKQKHEIFNKGKKILEKFYEREKYKHRTDPSLVEYKFNERILLEVGKTSKEVLFIGRIDKIDPYANQTNQHENQHTNQFALLTDYKCGASLSKITKEFCIQFTIYDLVYRKLVKDGKIFGSVNPQIVIYNLPFGREDDMEIDEYYTTRNDIDVEYLVCEIENLEKNLKQKHFVPFIASPRFDHCKRCAWSINDLCYDVLYSNNKEILKLLQEHQEK